MEYFTLKDREWTCSVGQNLIGQIPLEERESTLRESAVCKMPRRTENPLRLS
jgi:hypothetical protein